MKFRKKIKNNENLCEKCFSQWKPQRMRTRRVSHLPVAKGTKKRTPRLQSTISISIEYILILSLYKFKSYKFSYSIKIRLFRQIILFQPTAYTKYTYLLIYNTTDASDTYEKSP